MTTLAGHGKDDRLIQAELPIVPNKGDRIREDANPKDGSYSLACLVREGEFIGQVPVKGMSDEFAWAIRLDNGKQTFFNPKESEIIEKAIAPDLVEKEVNQSLLEQAFKVGDRVYQDNPDNTGVITKISRGKALVNVGGDRTVIVPFGKLHHCDPNYLPKAKKSQEEILAEEEAAIAKARDEYLKSEAQLVAVEVVGKEILLPFDYEIPDKEKGDENYTPDYFVEACRQFLGWFDLDPFSNAIAQKSIRAKTFWTKADNALTKDWTPYLKKIVNPPYSQGLIGKCIDKILEFCAIGETILIVNSSTSAKWFQRCINACSAYLNPSKRLPFYNPYREIQYLNGTKKRSGNEYDQTVFYFGDRPLEFAKAMEHLGSCSIPIKKSCLPISTCSGGLEPLALPPETQEKLPPSPIAMSPKTRKKSTKAISLKSPSTETSETIPHAKELTFLRVDSPATTQVLQETKKDLTETNLNSGLSTCDASKKESQDLSLSKIPQGCLIEEWEQSLKAYPKAGIMRNGRLYPLEPLAVPKLGSECSLSLPTMTTGLGSGRNAGATKLEKWLKGKGFVQSTQALSVEMMAVLFGFPKDWALCLLESPKEPKEETRQEPYSDEPSTSTAPPSSLNESCTLTEFSANNIDAETNLLLDQADLVADENSLELLLDQAKRLRESGAAPDGIWLSSSKVRDRDFYQVQWRSREQHPWLGNQKSRYVGISDSDEHKSAIALHRAGQQLRKIEKQIKKLQEKA